MIYKGQVKDGVVVLHGEVQLPDGIEVNVEPVESSQPEGPEREIPSLYERLEPFIGAIKGLPPDLAKNHDHYIHGAAKNEWTRFLPTRSTILHC